MARGRVAVTKDNVSPVVETLIWFCLVVCILTVLVRLTIKRYILRRFDLDDYFICISLFFAFAQSITISLAASNGLGKHLNSLDPLQLSSLLKAQYAATFLFLASVCFAKLSLVAYLRNLTPLALYRKVSLLIGLVVALWATTAILSAAFQCRLPRPWDYINNTCFSRTSWADYVAVINIATDVFLVGLPLVVVARLQSDKGKKGVLMLFFSARLCVVIAVICQLVYLHRTTTSSDITFDIWPVTICTQVIQCLSILTSCMVYLKPFLDSLETGFIQVGDMRRQNVPGFGFSPEHGSKNSKETKTALKYHSFKTKLSKLHTQDEGTELRQMARADLQYLGNSATAGTAPHDWDQHSTSHILRTTTLTVQRDDSKEQGHQTVDI